MILTDLAPILRMIRERPGDDGPRLVLADELRAVGELTPARVLPWVLAHPACDALRLLHADALEDRGECDRAEFIRLQCELARLSRLARHPGGRLAESCHCGCCVAAGPLRRRESELWAVVSGQIATELDGQFNVGLSTADAEQSPVTQWAFVSRGLVSALLCDTAWLLGGPCQRCGGGTRPVVDHRLRRPIIQCPDCKGDRNYRTEGHAAALFAAHPIAAVTLTDREPAHQRVEGYWFWVWPNPPATDALEDQAYFVPEPLAAILRKGPYEFSTRDDALTALDAAVVTHGRGLVGLPELEAAS